MCSGQVESTSGGGNSSAGAILPQGVGPVPAAVPVTTSAAAAAAAVMGYGSGVTYADHGCSPPVMLTSKMMRYSPTSTYSSPSPPTATVHHQQQQQHQLVEHQRQGPSTTLHHYSSAQYAGVATAADMYNSVCPPPQPQQPPSYEQAVGGQPHDQPQHHVHWYPASVISSHHQTSPAADRMQ